MGLPVLLLGSLNLILVTFENLMSNVLTQLAPTLLEVLNNEGHGADHTLPGRSLVKGNDLCCVFRREMLLICGDEHWLHVRVFQAGLKVIDNILGHVGRKALAHINHHAAHELILQISCARQLEKLMNLSGGNGMCRGLVRRGR